MKAWVLGLVLLAGCEGIAHIQQVNFAEGHCYPIEAHDFYGGVVSMPCFDTLGKPLEVSGGPSGSPSTLIGSSANAAVLSGGWVAAAPLTH